MGPFVKRPVSKKQGALPKKMGPFQKREGGLFFRKKFYTKLYFHTGFMENTFPTNLLSKTNVSNPLAHLVHEFNWIYFLFFSKASSSYRTFAVLERIRPRNRKPESFSSSRCFSHKTTMRLEPMLFIGFFRTPSLC